METPKPPPTEAQSWAKAVPWTWIVIVVASAITVYVSSRFCWFKRNEHVAIWLEGVALVLIFGLDFLSRKEEHEETMKQLEAATDQARFTEKAAIEAKKSSDILASLHRPLMGIEAPIQIANQNVRIWKIDLVAKNFGTLLATQVSVTTDIFTDRELRMTDPPAEVVEVFPGQAFGHSIMFDTGDTDRLMIHAGTKTLTAKIRFSYSDQSQRRFEHVAEAKFKGGHLYLTRTETTESSPART
jgi:hypothetical protein